MFNKSELSSIDKEYFTVLSANAYQVTLQSKNTLHEWHILAREDRVHGKVIHTCIINHRHNCRGGFHAHGSASTLADAMNMIKEHDVFQLNGRTQ